MDALGEGTDVASVEGPVGLPEREGLEESWETVGLPGSGWLAWGDAEEPEESLLEEPLLEEVELGVEGSISSFSSLMPIL